MFFYYLCLLINIFFRLFLIQIAMFKFSYENMSKPQRFTVGNTEI